MLASGSYGTPPRQSRYLHFGYCTLIPYPSGTRPGTNWLIYINALTRRFGNSAICPKMRVFRPLWLDEVSLRACAYRKRRILTSDHISIGDWSLVDRPHSPYKRSWPPLRDPYGMPVIMLGDISLDDHGICTSERSGCGGSS